VELTQPLAAQAAVAIENARLYESSTRWLRQLESLNEIGNALGIALLGSLLTVVFRMTFPGDATGIAEFIEESGTTSPEFAAAQAAFLDGYHVVAALAGIICVALGLLAVRWIPRDAVAHGDPAASQQPVDAVNT
jgi:MFS transporter, DHA2 family, multidrug resistance protein